MKVFKKAKDPRFFDWLNNVKDLSDRGARIAIFRHSLFILTFAAGMFLLACWLLKM